MVHSPSHPRPDRATPAAEDEHALSAELERAVVRFHRMITSVGQRHGLGEAEADEVMQEVRLRLWRNRGEVETLRSLGASYVYRTAVSAALDLIRARRARRTGLDAVVPLDGIDVAATHDAAADVEDRELADRVMTAVDGLAPNRRPVVRMHLAGYEREEIARVLGWSVGKVRNLLSRGLVDLREALAAERPGPDGGR
jgi:RNA polymerase sigma-70 factor, ECF subfamily